MSEFDTEQSDVSLTPKGLSRIRIAYLGTYGTAILGMLIILGTMLINGQGEVDPALTPYAFTGSGLMFIGLVSTMFFVRCGNCKTKLWSLMRRTESSDHSLVSVQYSGDKVELFSFMLKKNVHLVV